MIQYAGTGKSGMWIGDIPEQSEEGLIDYYITASDGIQTNTTTVYSIQIVSEDKFVFPFWIIFVILVGLIFIVPCLLKIKKKKPPEEPLTEKFVEKEKDDEEKEKSTKKRSD
jgi:hypothetical protein